MSRHLLLIVCIALLFSACHHRDKVRYSTSSEHTLLVYMIGDDNTLNPHVEPNLWAMRQGLLDSETPVNLIVYRDNRTALNDKPQLYQLKRRANSNRTDTIFLKKWTEELCSTDPEVISEVMRLTFSKFDTHVKGMEIWGHGWSWLPSTDFQSGRTTRALQWVGADENKKAELWSFRNALEQSGYHLDYLMFDACHMATAEAAYELRNNTDYILAAPNEIAAEGFPYRKMIASLSTIQSPRDLESGLTAAFHDYQTVYQDNGAFTLLRTAGMESLLRACRSLEETCDSTLTEWQNDPKPHQKGIQQYGRSVTKGSYLFYDVEDWSRQLCEDNKDGSPAAVQQALRECVLETFASPTFHASGEAINLKRCCGLAMSVPEFWSLSEQKKLDEAYSLIQWNL